MPVPEPSLDAIAGGLSSPALRRVVITPSDTVDLPGPTPRGIQVCGATDGVVEVRLTLVNEDPAAGGLIERLASYAILQVAVKRVWASGLTAGAVVRAIY